MELDDLTKLEELLIEYEATHDRVQGVATARYLNPLFIAIDGERAALRLGETSPGVRPLPPTQDIDIAALARGEMP